MLFDIGWPELLLIGAVALVVIGPKDLPRALRVAGFWVRKARTLSREFQSSIDQMIREAELEEMKQELQKATEIDVAKEIRKTIDPTGELAESLKPPETPDFFDPAPTPTIHAASETPRALAPPVEEPLPEQVAMASDPFLEPELPLPAPSQPPSAAPAAAHETVPPKP